MKKIGFILFTLVFLLCACNTHGNNLNESSQESVTTSEERTPSAESSQKESSSSVSENTSEESMPSQQDFPRIVIGGVAVTAENSDDVFGDGTVRIEYNENNGFVTVFLSNANIKADVFPDSDEIESINGIFCNKPLIINLQGKNVISMNIPNIDYFQCYGIRSDFNSSVSVCGGGTLEITAKSKGSAHTVVGINTNALEINEASVNICVLGSQRVIGIYAEKLSIVCGSLYVQSGNAPTSHTVYRFDKEALPKNLLIEEGTAEDGALYLNIVAE